MTNRLGIPVSAGRRNLACSECGASFSCDLSGECWCVGESATLPMPTSGGDCLCRDCLRAKAAAQRSEPG